ncbi:MAG: energy transducer TonB [Pseudomonadota bacterium]
MFRFAVAVVSAFAAALSAQAQTQVFETCASRSECAAAIAENIRQSEDLIKRQRYQEGAQYLYPALATKNTNLSTRSRLEASTALAKLLSEAGLYGYAALEARTSNRFTSAPSSEGLLYEARLLDLAGEPADANDVYARAETLAIASANLKSIDRLITDYDTRGDIESAERLRSSRRDIAARFDQTCSQARCRSATEVPAIIQNSIRANYPSDAQRQRLSGSCRVIVNVSETGDPQDIRTNCTDPVFNDSAYDAARRSRFSPRFKNGAPQPDYDLILPIEFALR